MADGEASRRAPAVEVATICFEPATLACSRGRDILERFPDAQRIEVPSRWRIPDLHGTDDNVDAWVHTKRSVLVLGIKKTLSERS